MNRSIASSMAAPVSNASSTTCHLLELPAELRNRIWEHSIIHEQAIKLLPLGFYSDQERTDAGSQPELTRVCSQIRNETLSMFYTCNTFRLHTSNLTGGDSDADGCFLRLLAAHATELRHIEMQVCKHQNFYRLDLDGSKRTFTWIRVLQEEKEHCAVGNSYGFELASRYLEKALASSSEIFALSKNHLVKLAAVVAF